MPNTVTRTPNVDGWFPRLSPDGRHVVSGNREIWFDLTKVGPGTQPDWLWPQTIIYRDLERPVLHIWTPGGTHSEVRLARGCNWISANGRGQWAAFLAQALPIGNEVITGDGRVFPNCLGPSIGPDGSVVMIDNDGRLVISNETGVSLMIRDTHANVPRLNDAGLAWTTQKARFQPPVICDLWNPINECFYVVPVNIGVRGSVLVVEEGRLVLYEQGYTDGHIVATGNTEYPDAKALDNRYVRVVWCDRGVLCDTVVDTWEPRKDLRRSSPTRPPVDPPKPDPPKPEPPMTIPKLSEIKIASPMSDESVLSWPVTSKVTEAFAGPAGASVEHTMAGRWPVSRPLDEKTDIEGNLWHIVRIDDEWVAGTTDWLRPGQTEKSFPASEIGPRFKAGYDAYRGPRAGELVGLFVSTIARSGNVLPRDQRQRSNIVWVRFNEVGIVGEEDKGPISGPEPKPEPDKPQEQDPVLERLIDTVERLMANQAAILVALEDLRGRALKDGDRVALRTHKDYVVCAEGGGGSEVNASRTDPGPWETFTLEKQ